MKQIKGAEATVEIGAEGVVKKREPKKYRHRDIDQKIREERTDTELHLIEEARKYNVSVPKAEKKDDSTLQIEKVDGKQLKEVLKADTELMKDYGENIALLHSTDIIHGDLTTSNAIVDPEDDIHIIDFGLAFRSQRLEDKAVDIHLLKQVLESSHPEITGEAWESFLEGYREYGEVEEVLEQLEEVEKRGRYK